MIQNIKTYLEDKFGNAEVIELSNRATNIVVNFRDLVLTYTFITDERTLKTQMSLQLKSATEFKFTEFDEFEKLVSSTRIIKESWEDISRIMV